MTFQTITLPLYPQHPFFLAYYDNVAPEVLATVKSELISRNPEYDFCFLSTTYLVSLEQLHCALHKAVQNLVQGTMKAKSVNTEIIFDLSPVNNINDALKRFGIDETRTDLIVVKLSSDTGSFEQLDNELAGLLNAKSTELTDDILMQRADLKKFKKLFKLLDASDYTQGAISATLLRGL